MELKFAGIRRKTEFSPDHVIDDSLIIEQTASEIERLGAAVELYDESALGSLAPTGEYVFSMVQGADGIQSLMALQSSVKFIINTPQSVLNCYPYNMIRLLPRAGIPFPRCQIVDTCGEFDGPATSFNGKKFWVKRGDTHAVHKEDVSLVYHEDEMKNIIKEFGQRGIAQAVLQEHIPGDIVKFYAVAGTEFFHWYYLNGDSHHSFSQGHLRSLAGASAQALGLVVYGGDAVIGEHGEIIIIDVNGWPGFAPVRDEASKTIAKLLYDKGKEHEKEKSQIFPHAHRPTGQEIA